MKTCILKQQFKAITINRLKLTTIISKNLTNIRLAKGNQIEVRTKKLSSN